MSSLVVSLVKLPRQIGACRQEVIDWVVPDGWDVGVSHLEAGKVVPLDVQLTTVDDGVLVQVSASGELLGECVRCLDPVSETWDVDTADVYFEAAKAAEFVTEGDIDVVGEPEDEPRVIATDTVDLEPLLRDAILAGAALQPLCREDCLGLCSGCGERMEDLPEDHNHDQIDPRFAALQSLLTETDE